MSTPSTRRWRRVEVLFHAALALPAQDQQAFLAAECGGEQALLDEVTSLVLADADGGAARYEDWAPQVAAAWAADTTGSLAGQTVGRYRVLEPLGAGATGEVYRAEDMALGRHVALKVLLPTAGEAGRLQRLEQEARAASALNHPNILTIHEIGLTSGIHFIATELVTGETLRERLARGIVPLAEAANIVVQVAGGLRAAHDAGVIHRDIKPENLMVRPDGVVKILDFGLAGPHLSTASGIDSHAEAAAAAIGGTLGYMSPEQARGEPLDARSDLFSLGVVLYEMVNGTLPHERGSASPSLDATVSAETSRSRAENRVIATDLDRVIARLLAETPERRHQTASELEADLKHVLAATAGAGQAPSAGLDNPVPDRSRRRQRHLRLALAALSVTVVAGGLAWLTAMRRPDSSSVDPARFVFVRLTKQAGEELFPSLSPRADAVVYASPAAGNWDIYLQPIGGDPVNLTGDAAADDVQPVYAPDGRRILFRSERGGGGLFVMSARGQSVTRVSDIGWDPAWSPDGRQIACSSARVEPTTVRLPESQLWIVDLGTGHRRWLSEGPAFQPHWSPSGKRIAFFAADRAGQRDIWTIAAAGGEPVRVTADEPLDWNPVWSADGRFLYFLSDRDGPMNTWRVRIDEETGQVLEPPQPLVLPSPNVMFLARASGNEALTWSSRFGGGVLRRYQLDPVRGAVLGAPVTLTSASRSLLEPEVSPDGTLLVANTRGEPRDDIVLLRPDGSQVRALTNDAPHDRYPRWSPDGRRIAFWSDRSGGTAIFLISVDGTGLQQIAGAQETHSCCPVWSPDGREVAYLAADLTIRAVDLTASSGAARERVLARLPDGVWFQPASWSADGSRLAGQERRGNNPRSGIALYDLRSGKYTRLTERGGRPVWLSDNRRLLYNDTSSVWTIDTASGRRQQLFSIDPYQSAELTVTRDDRQLFVSVRANEADVWVATPH